MENRWCTRAVAYVLVQNGSVCPHTEHSTMVAPGLGGNRLCEQSSSRCFLSSRNVFSSRLDNSCAAVRFAVTVNICTVALRQSVVWHFSQPLQRFSMQFTAAASCSSVNDVVVLNARGPVDVEVNSSWGRGRFSPCRVLFPPSVPSFDEILFVRTVNGALDHTVSGALDLGLEKTPLSTSENRGDLTSVSSG